MISQNLLTFKKREERIVDFFALVSLIGIITGAVFGILFLITGYLVFETIAISGLIAFILPFVLLQFFMSAGIYPYRLGKISFLFYFIVFPFADIWFFGCINVLLQIIPNYPINDQIARTEFMQKSWLFAVGIYILINGAGMLWKIGKKSLGKAALISFLALGIFGCRNDHGKEKVLNVKQYTADFIGIRTVM